MRRLIGPDTVVLDLGAGTGALSLLACRLGAARVYAIEPNPAVRMLRANARRNGYADRIHIHLATADKVDLPERVDLILADVRGSMPLAGGTLGILRDACARFLKPGGLVMPARDRIFVAPVTEQTVRARQQQLWLNHGLDIDMSATFEHELGHMHRTSAGYDTRLADAQHWGTIEYAPTPCVVQAPTLVFTVGRGGEMDGLMAWFDLDFVDGVHLSNRPDLPDSTYGRTFFSMTRSIDVAPGDRVELTFAVHEMPGGETWIWRGRVIAVDGRERARFSESSLKSRVPYLETSGTAPTAGMLTP